ncbi:class I SAM-dependent methyltransferase [Microlunatus elymi]|uniref:Class I SAM-dependent methyltransferase n=1 Tax=Microlunatus elymi TaxID=2596828 RepID=A0A516PYL8_9ACTN|nr:class I SAM-dependent methyltransferase [Microlunatus elymi]QDP96263.1 class I SAM-dependent methyltransferase [Microlunatus elymi]
MPIGNERQSVREQYGRETGLTTRMSIWQPPADGITPQDIAVEILRAADPKSLLEIGCGTGLLAERISRELPGTDVLATDQSERMVELTAERGVAAQVVDADDLPFDDDRFEAVLAAWMLYHVPDLDRTLAGVRRVLRPGGSFVAITNGDHHAGGLLAAAGAPLLITQFSSENGEAALRRHFDRVEACEVTPLAVADHQRAQEYLASFDAELAANLPPYEGERSYPGAVTLFTAR